MIKITDDTKAVQKKKGEDEPTLVKVDLEKLETKFKKYEDAGGKSPEGDPREGRRIEDRVPVQEEEG